MDQEKMKAYYQMWSEAWKQFRKWLVDYQDDDSFWQRLLREGEEFCNQYKGTDVEQFAKKVILDIIEELETVATGKRGNE